ncbi:MAG: glycine cleavage system aminomethyltransferase GcvT [Deltaproteobacteria bacterium]|nr:glycine cleavage system aminomethyltransferase GcvT [Deltaproteobacteria bacterium]
MRKTPLYDHHAALGAKFTNFGGWSMPVQYTNIIEEHLATRNIVGLFDICHMGQIEVKGHQGFSFLQQIMSRNLEGQKPGQIKLCVMTNEEGGILDDLTVYKLEDELYMLVTNASTRQKDFEWLINKSRELGFDQLQIKDIGDETGKLDIQGPKAQKVLQRLLADDLTSLRFYRAIRTTIQNMPVILSRSGYTGEDGFEIYSPANKTGELWDLILKTGADEGIKPVGLGARDTLRLEAGMMLYGHEMDETITPFEVVYDWLVDLKKDFIGCAALRRQKEDGIPRKLVGFEMIDRGIARADYKIWKDGRDAGIVTSGTFSPSLHKAIGMAFVPLEYSQEQTEMDIEIRGGKFKAKITSLPFYKRKK